MVNKKKRLFKLLFFPLSLLLCLSIFLINSFASSGFIVDNNGNIKSYNLFDGNLVNGYHSGSNGQLTLISGNLVTNNDLISLDHNRNFTLSFETSNNNIFLDGICYYGSNGDFRSYEQLTYQTSPFTFLLNDYEFFITFNFVSNSSINSNDVFNVMLNEGSTALDYFPYGYYYNGGVINNLSLYNLFNGGSAFLYWSNNIDVGLIEYDELSLNENATSITLNDMPTIRDYLSTHAINDNTLYSIMISTPYNISSYANLRLTYNPNSFNIDYLSVKLSGRNNLYNMYYPTNSDNVIICSTFNLEYTDVMINGFYNYTSDSFNLSLNNFDTGYYNRGYTDGYNNGLTNGNSQGYASGYQVGLTDGMNTDITTNGIKTLFNSILSFPVDMIKNVFNFDFMGVNVASVIMFIISIGIVAFVLKKFL